MVWLSIATLVLLQVRNVWILVGVRLIQGIAVGAYFVIASIYVK
jgi:MFS family permease